MKSLLTFSFTLVIAVSFCAAGAFASDGQAEAPPTPLLQELNALAQQQLDRRALLSRRSVTFQPPPQDKRKCGDASSR